MSKKYQIINPSVDSNNINECTIFYLLYIVLFFVIIFIIYKVIFCIGNKNEENKNEGFKNINTTDTTNMTNTNKQNVIEEKTKELLNFKNTLENRLMEQSQAIYLSQNFNRVDPSSFNDQLTFLLADFADTKFPEINVDGKKLINNQTELDTVLSEASNMKNFYKPGEIVESNSTFGIGKNEICYRQNNKPIKPTPEFLAKYPNCMVCAVEDETDNIDLKNTQGWINTKTNISKVCLYDPNAKLNSGIPNLAQCKNFCNVKIDPALKQNQMPNQTQNLVAMPSQLQLPNQMQISSTSPN